MQQAGIKVTVTATGGNLPAGGTTLEIANMIPAGGIDANNFSIESSAILSNAVSEDLVQANANGTRSAITLENLYSWLTCN